MWRYQTSRYLPVCDKLSSPVTVGFLDARKMASSQPKKPFVTKYHGKTQLTSTEFMEVFRKFDKDGNGYIEARELDPFLQELFEARYHGLAKDKVKEMRELILERYDKNYDGRLEIDELAQILPTEQNFLLQFHRESKLTSVEFMKIWNHYDVYREGYLEKKHLRGFFKDLMTVNNPHVSPQRIEEFVNGALDSFDKNQDGEIELSEMAKLLPVEENFLSKFQVRENLSRAEFEKIWYHYDQVTKRVNLTIHFSLPFCCCRCRCLFVFLRFTSHRKSMYKSG
ncbi:hypothetical protein pdam_00009126 [Pocillopora damicornis]|uniref:EF-hand domain-containing protein n=1 Tax=Pocillopora damicornis TaxID=46731 RepID=A0A3M6U839_POCDA|nr:hypothetical protein pdam_00009126 [Pocillopora damicornis]